MQGPVVFQRPAASRLEDFTEGQIGFWRPNENRVDRVALKQPIRNANPELARQRLFNRLNPAWWHSLVPISNGVAVSLADRARQTGVVTFATVGRQSDRRTVYI